MAVRIEGVQNKGILQISNSLEFSGVMLGTCTFAKLVMRLPLENPYTHVLAGSTIVMLKIGIFL